MTEDIDSTQDTLPPRPQASAFHVGYDDVPPGILPKKRDDRRCEFLAQVEWDFSPVSNLQSAYFLQATRKNWVLWEKSFDDNEGRWDWTARGYVAKPGVSPFAAAVYLLMDYWKFDESQSQPGRYHFVDRTGCLDAACLNQIAKAVWAPREECAPKTPSEPDD